LPAFVGTPTSKRGSLPLPGTDGLPGSPGPEEAYQDRALAERICALLDAEPERTRNIVLMRIAGFSFYEIGLKYGVSENSARVIDFRAKAKIRKILEKEWFDGE